MSLKAELSACGARCWCLTLLFNHQHLQVPHCHCQTYPIMLLHCHLPSLPLRLHVSAALASMRWDSGLHLIHESTMLFWRTIRQQFRQRSWWTVMLEESKKQGAGVHRIASIPRDLFSGSSWCNCRESRLYTQNTLQNHFQCNSGVVSRPNHLGALLKLLTHNWIRHLHFCSNAVYTRSGCSNSDCYL